MAQTMAACLVLLLDAAHNQDQSRESELTKPIYEVVSAFQALSPLSRIASHGAGILTVLLEAHDPALESHQLPASSLSREASQAARRLLASWWQRKSPSSIHTDPTTSSAANPTELHGMGLYPIDDIDLFEFLDFSQTDHISLFGESPQHGPIDRYSCDQSAHEW